MSVRKLGKISLSVVLFAMLIAQNAHASKTVSSPKVTKGKYEVEIQGGLDFDGRSSKDGKEKYKVELGYGITDWWAFEVENIIEDTATDNDHKLTALEFENTFQLSGEDSVIDYGFLLTFKLGVDGSTNDKLESKILLEKKLGDFKHTANIQVNKEVGNGHDKEAEGKFAWRTKYYLDYHFRPGFEYYADFGEFKEKKSYDNQNHQIGPVLYGHLTKHIEYEIGYLFGVSDAAPDGSLKWILEYEREF